MTVISCAFVFQTSLLPLWLPLLLSKFMAIFPRFLLASPVVSPNMAPNGLFPSRMFVFLLFVFAFFVFLCVSSPNHCAIRFTLLSVLGSHSVMRFFTFIFLASVHRFLWPSFEIPQLERPHRVETSKVIFGRRPTFFEKSILTTKIPFTILSFTSLCVHSTLQKLDQLGLTGPVFCSTSFSHPFVMTVGVNDS